MDAEHCEDEVQKCRLRANTGSMLAEASAPQGRAPQGCARESSRVRSTCIAGGGGHSLRGAFTLPRGTMPYLGCLQGLSEVLRPQAALHSPPERLQEVEGAALRGSAHRRGEALQGGGEEADGGLWREGE